MILPAISLVPAVVHCSARGLSLCGHYLFLVVVLVVGVGGSYMCGGSRYVLAWGWVIFFLTSFKIK